MPPAPNLSGTFATILIGLRQRACDLDLARGCHQLRKLLEIQGTGRRTASGCGNGRQHPAVRHSHRNRHARKPLGGLLMVECYAVASDANQFIAQLCRVGDRAIGECGEWPVAR